MVFILSLSAISSDGLLRSKRSFSHSRDLLKKMAGQFNLSLVALGRQSFEEGETALAVNYFLKFESAEAQVTCDNVEAIFSTTQDPSICELLITISGCDLTQEFDVGADYEDYENEQQSIDGESISDLISCPIDWSP